MLDIFSTVYGQLGVFGLLCLVVLQIYRDMRKGMNGLIREQSDLRGQFTEFMQKDHASMVAVLQDNVSSRERLIESIDGLKDETAKLGKATEGLPCNQDQPARKRYNSPAHGTTAPTPPSGNKT